MLVCLWSNFSEMAMGIDFVFFCILGRYENELQNIFDVIHPNYENSQVYVFLTDYDKKRMFLI